MFVCTVPNEESYIIHSNYHFREMFEYRVHTQLESDSRSKSKNMNKEEVEIHEIMPACMQKDHQLAVRTGMGTELYGHGGGPYYF